MVHTLLCRAANPQMPGYGNLTLKSYAKSSKMCLNNGKLNMYTLAIKLGITSNIKANWTKSNELSSMNGCCLFLLHLN